MPDPRWPDGIPADQDHARGTCTFDPATGCLVATRDGKQGIAVVSIPMDDVMAAFLKFYPQRFVMGLHGPTATIA